jgi:hypothetical protein
MPMFQTVAAFLAAALLAFLVAAALRPEFRAKLLAIRFWLALAGLASLASAVSALVEETGHAGTGFVTRRGWPKPYWFDFAGEHGERSTSFDPLYFAGNALGWGAALLLAWTAWRVVRAGASSAQPET